MAGTYASGIDVNQKLWLSPKKIVYCASREFAPEWRGHIVDGDWDRISGKFQELDIYIAFDEVCLEGKEWSRTLFYQRVLEKLDRGAILWGCRDRNDLDRRCEELELLFRKIEAEGYRSQDELMASAKGNYDLLESEDEVAVSIGRHGDLLFSNGAHRLAIAKLLGVPQIPVIVTVRHAEWLKFRNELERFARDNRISHPLMHPDLDDIAVISASEDKFTTIKDCLTTKNGRILEIEAGLGYFCHRFEDEGFECYASEVDPEKQYFLRKIRRAENKRFEVIEEAISNCPEIQNTRFDALLALNGFSHLLKSAGDYWQLSDLLNTLQAREFFINFDVSRWLPPPDASQSNFPDGIVEFLIRNSKLSYGQPIAGTADEGILYRFV